MKINKIYFYSLVLIYLLGFGLIRGVSAEEVIPAGGDPGIPFCREDIDKLIDETVEDFDNFMREIALKPQRRIELPLSKDKIEEISAISIDLEFTQANIEDVLRGISEAGEFNIMLDPELKGKKVDLHLKKTTIPDVLELLTTAYDLGSYLVGNALFISTQDKIKEALERGPLDTQTFTLNFARAAEVQSAIEKLITDRGRVSLEPRTNTLIISDATPNLVRLEQIIRGLDKHIPQVMIEAKIIETTLGREERLGIDWTMKIAASGSKRPTTLPFKTWEPNRSFYPEPKREVSYEYKAYPWAADGSTDPSDYYLHEEITSDFWFDPTRGLSSFPMAGAEQFLFGTLDFSEFQAVLEILDQRTDTNIISNPRITTLNNQEAKILVGTIIPIPIYDFSRDTGTRVISGYQDQEVGIQLLVTPIINDEGYVTLSVTPRIESIVDWTGPFNERPIISTRSAETKVMVKDGETLAIGGLITEDKINVKKKVPLLGSIPGLGLLFTKRTDEVRKRDLVIFITPRIIYTEALSPGRQAGL